MGELEGKVLRFAAPVLYQRLVDIFTGLHLQPYDVHGTLQKNEGGFLLSLRFSADFSQSVSMQITFNQAENPDEEIDFFLMAAAEQCKTALIADYYRKIKL